MSDYGLIGEGAAKAARAALIMVGITVPFAVWKLVEIACWIWQHVSISVQ